jgi:hypothetical protein
MFAIRCLLGVATVALFSLTGDEPSHAQVVVPAGWTALGQVTLDKSGCASCPATFPTTNRHRSFGLASDTPYPLNLSGRIDVTCADGTTYEVLLKSSGRGGLFQIVPNTCVNFDAKQIGVTTTTVSLSPPDADRKVNVTVYGRVG